MFLSWMRGASDAAATEVQVGSQYPLPTQEFPATSAAAVSASDTVAVAAGRSFVINCTVAGNVKVKFADGTALTIAVAVGTLILPWAVILVFVTGTTATATFANVT